MTATYAEALEDCKTRVTASRTSFHAGMAMLPRTRREGMYAFYAFCREVDDIADDGETLEKRKAGLQQWRGYITDLFRGQSDNTITAALSPAVKRFNLIEKDFQDIIDGMEMDAGSPICAPDFKTLDLYCDRVASAVGRVSVRIFGDDREQAMAVSYHLGRAFQLTNILRDIAEDAARGRLYLPEELLAKHNVKSHIPAEVLRDPNLQAVCRELSTTAGDYFAAADAAMKLCKPSAMRPALIMRSYYGAIYKRLVALDWRDPTQRVCLPKWQKLLLMVRAFVIGA
jgi:presqualene diphosphate synthase